MSDLKQMYKQMQKDSFPDTMRIILGDETLVYEKRTWNIDNEKKGLRYGENPDQPAALYQMVEGKLSACGIEWRGPEHGMVSAITEEHMLQAGKHPGKTNLTDVDNGANILQYLTKHPAAIILKHNNPCGAAWSCESIGAALHKAFWCDRIAAFGGAVVVNRELDLDAAKLISENYFEVVAAPSFAEGTLELIKARKNLRIIRLPGLASLDNLVNSSFLDIKSLSDGGLIVQKSFVNSITDVNDFLPAAHTDANGVSVNTRKPTAQELDDLYFAWAVEAGVTSNSVIFAKNGATVAIGTGEQDRVGCVELAINKAYTKYADRLCFVEQKMSLYELSEKANTDEQSEQLLEDILNRTEDVCGDLKGSVCVSDGFFPFRDGVDVAIAEGITAIGQPGGSMRDNEVIMACNESITQVAMVFTAQRSFKH